MGLLGDMLAGAADRGGAAIERAAFAQHEANVREEAAKRLEEHRSRLAEDATVRAEQRGIENRTEERRRIFEETKDRAPELTKLEIDKARQLGELRVNQAYDELVKLGPERTRQAVEQQTAVLKARSTPEALKAARAIAQATHIVDPSYQLVPLADGTIATVDTKSGKAGGVLKGADGEPLVRKDSEELKAVTAALNYAQGTVKIAETEYRTALNSVKDVTTDPAEKQRVTERAEAELTLAKKRAEELASSALATLMRKGKTTAPKAPGMIDAGPEGYPGGGSAGTARPPLSSFGSNK